jgi:hypothetical protein
MGFTVRYDITIPGGRHLISECAMVAATKDYISANLADEEVVILKLEAGVYFGLDAVGARVWNLIQEPISVNDVRDVLLEEYDVDPGRCEGDRLRLLGQLAAQGLIEVKDAAGT